MGNMNGLPAWKKSLSFSDRFSNISKLSVYLPSVCAVCIWSQGTQLKEIVLMAHVTLFSNVVLQNTLPTAEVSSALDLARQIEAEAYQLASSLVCLPRGTSLLQLTLGRAGRLPKSLSASKQPTLGVRSCPNFSNIFRIWSRRTTHTLWQQLISRVWWKYYNPWQIQKRHTSQRRPFFYHLSCSKWEPSGRCT